MTYSASAQVTTSLTSFISSSTLTSYMRSMEGVTQFAITTTAMIYDGGLALSSVLQPGCGASFEVDAKPGDKVYVSFSSDTPIEFYLMAEDQGGDALCTVGGYAIPPNLAAASYRTSYSLEWSPSVEYYRINRSTDFYLLLFNIQNAPASVHLTVRVTTNQMTTTTMYSTRTTLLVLLITQTSSLILVMPSTSVPTSYLPSVQDIWIVLTLIVLAGLVIIVLSRKRRGSPKGPVTKFCRKCGSTLEIGDQFCSNCGTKQP